MHSKILRFTYRPVRLMKYLLPFIAVLLLLNLSSCNKHSYPCPGLGMSNEADISQFDENGALKTSTGKKKKAPTTVGRFNRDNGLINKKNPKQLQTRARKRV